MPITVRLTPDEEARLSSLAERTGRKRSYYVKQALAEYLDDMEDLYLAEQVDLRVQAGTCLLYTSPSPRDSTSSRMPSSA